jgi:hypothetical protein
MALPNCSIFHFGSKQQSSDGNVSAAACLVLRLQAPAARHCHDVRDVGIRYEQDARCSFDSGGGGKDGLEWVLRNARVARGRARIRWHTAHIAYSARGTAITFPAATDPAAAAACSMRCACSVYSNHPLEQ